MDQQPLTRTGLPARNEQPGLAGDEVATATLEVLLSLPLMFIVVALVINLGYGGFMRMRTSAASRFAATHRVYADSLGNPTSDYWRPPPEEWGAVRSFYFPEGGAPYLNLREAHVPIPWHETDEDPPKDAGFLVAWLEGMSQRHEAHLEVPREVPTGTLLEPSPVTGFLALDGNTWTCHELPLTLQELTAQPGNLLTEAIGGDFGDGLGELLKYVVGGPFYLFGMQGGIGESCT